MFSPTQVNPNLQEYNIEYFKHAQNISSNLKYTTTWDSIFTYFVARENHTFLFISSIEENNRNRNLPNDFIKFYGYYSCVFLDNIFLQELPCIIGRDSLCIGQTDTLRTTITAPRRWCTDPKGLNTFSTDSFVYIDVNSKQQTIYCFGQNGMDSITIHVIGIEDPNWADTIHLCDHQTISLNACTNDYKYTWNDGSYSNKRIVKE